MFNSSSIGFLFFVFLILRETGKTSFNLQVKHLGCLNYQNSGRIEQGSLDFIKIILMNGVGVESTGLSFCLLILRSAPKHLGKTSLDFLRKLMRYTSMSLSMTKF